MTTTLQIRAVAVGEMEELETYTVAFAENSDGSGRGVFFELSMNITDQDVELGEDTYAITTPEGRTYYGGVLEWRVEESAVHLRLTEQAADTIGVDEDLVLWLDGPQDMNSIAQGLDRLFSVSGSE